MFTGAEASTFSLLPPSQTPSTVHPQPSPTTQYSEPFSMLRVVRRLFRPTITHSSLRGRYVRLEVISGQDLKVPSERIPAGIHISINVDSRRCWKSAISVLSYEELATWADTVTLPPQASPAFSVEITASYEADRILGSGEVIGKLQLSWHELLNHGDESFNLSFPSVRGVDPSLTLKVAVVRACDDALSDSFIHCKIDRDTDAGHARLVKYVKRKRVSHLKAAVQHFQLVLGQCPVSHPDRAAALTNLAWARLQGYTRNDLQDIDATTSLFREALALRPQHHPDHPLSLYNLTEALNWRHDKESTAADIREAAQLYHELLPLCPEGTYLRSTAAGENGVDYVIGGCNDLPIDASEEGICLLELCPLGHRHRPRALDELAWTLIPCFTQRGNIDDLDESIRFLREAVSLCPEGHFDLAYYLNNLTYSLRPRFDHQGKPNDLDEAISLYKAALRLRPVGHEYCDTSLDTLGQALITRFKIRKDIDDTTRALSLHHEALTLLPPGHAHHDITLHNLALALKIRYDELDVSEDINEAIDLSALCSRFTHTQKNEDVDVEEAITLCQESLIIGGFAFNAPEQIQHNPTDLSLAVDNFRLASGHPTQGFPDRIQIALHWVAEVESHQHDSAFEAYQVCMELFDSHVMTRSSIISRREAATAFRATTYRKLMEQWEAAVAEIRSLQAFSRFLLPPSYADLQAAACHGPVIILIASKYSCSAIIVPTSGDPHHVPLSSITLADLKTLKDRFTRAIRHTSRMNPTEPRTDLIVLLWIVWDEIMLPIVNVLENVLKLKRRSRIWLCPTAAFTSVPLHAAHPFQTRADRSKEPCLEDLFICSYTPTLSALIRSRRMMKKRVSPSFVAIGQGQPGAGKGKALSAVDSELELVHKLIPATATHTTIFGDAATRAGALEGLEENTWVHLACHGKQDPAQPYDSHFVMRDEHLTLLDIMDKHIPHAEFAFLSLSACHTAVGDEETPDEVIHLAAGLQFSGFKSVVGTLWEVDDAVAKHVVEASYTYMFHPKEVGVMDATKAAWALNCATHAVKTKVSLEQRMFHGSLWVLHPGVHQVV
ncbi:CHAT domain-containing protein [Suillus placidus]|uniref:CHAT domain-containing protein n=1 Tax=Suillus placidus TaxID=48579 RepID=A0A9P6ZWY5_9AGAM|nr:CHAT domain-containing protein [Suillus placidus]